MSWLPILAYHRIAPVLPEKDEVGNCVSVADFERQLAWLSRRGYRSLPLAALEDAIGPGGMVQGALPKRSLVITFDDGYRDNYLYAWPLLLRYGFGATVFLVTDAIGGDSSFDSGYHGPPVRMLSRAQIREMHRYGIDFGSHSCSHPPSLAELGDVQLMQELQQSKCEIEDLLGTPVRHFAYPYCRFDGRVEQALADAGYSLACAGTGAKFSRYRLHRVDAHAASGASLELYTAWRRATHVVKSRLHAGRAARTRVEAGPSNGPASTEASTDAGLDALLQL